MILFDTAIQELGVQELPGNKHNDRILNYAKEAGFEFVSEDETPWCSIFLSWVCLQCGYERSKSPLAKSWLQVGVPIQTPKKGDLVILWRVHPESWQGHVGFFQNFARYRGKQYVLLLGGNQKNKVSISPYPASRVIAYRKLRHYTDMPDYWELQ